MSDMIRVTLAPWRRLKIEPHPAGEAFGSCLWLEGGDQHLVTAEEAGRLYVKGTVLHPVTGQERPATATLANAPSITINGRLLAPGEVIMPSREEVEAKQARADAEVDKRNAALKRSPPSDKDPKVTFFNHDGSDTEGSWPTFGDTRHRPTQPTFYENIGYNGEN